MAGWDQFSRLSKKNDDEKEEEAAAAAFAWFESVAKFQ